MISAGGSVCLTIDSSASPTRSTSLNIGTTTDIDPVSVKSVIAPQAHQIAIEILAERNDLPLETATQLSHEALIRSCGVTVYESAVDDPQRLVTSASRHQLLHTRVQSAPDASAPYRKTTYEIVEEHRADLNCGVRLDQLDRRRVIDVQEAKHLAHCRRVVVAEVVVDEREDLLAGEDGVVAAQLLDVAHIV